MHKDPQIKSPNVLAFHSQCDQPQPELKIFAIIDNGIPDAACERFLNANMHCRDLVLQF